MFQALVRALPFSFASLYVPGLSTSAIMYGPSHGGESLWRPLLSCRSLSTKSPLSRSRRADSLRLIPS